MSEAGITPALMVKTLPKCVLRKDKLRVIKPNGMNSDLLARLRSLTQPQMLNKDIIIYESAVGDFLNLGDQKVTLINRTILSSNSSHTVARYESNGQVVLEKTSEEIVKLIGKANYELVFSTLCSVINQEFKVRGILALLTTPKKVATSACQTFGMIDSSVCVKRTDSCSQTEKTCIDFMRKMQPKRRVKRQLPSPYVVTDLPKVKRVVIHPSEYFSTNDVANSEIPHITIKQEDSKLETVDDMDIHGGTHTELPELHLDEDSRDSTGNVSITSFVTTPELLTQPLSLLKSIEKVTITDQPKAQTVDWGNAIPLTLLDGTVVKIPVKPEDDFHIATPEIIRFVPPEHRRKLLWYQAYIDWKYCLRRDDENHLPIHTAVINQDIDFLRRQCIVLGTKNESVDIPTGDNMSALQLSIYGGAPACTAMLLRFGADALAVDDEYRTCFHLAAEARNECLKPLIAHCQGNPLKVLQENDEFWKPELASKPKEYQASFLLNAICSTPDNQGYTPLMLAAKVGNFENAKLLVEAAPGAVNVQTSASGDTALYQAVAGACHDSDARGNRSKVSDNFKKIIALLVENGADPNLTNNSGADINTLLTEFNIGELSMLIVSTLTSVNCKNLNSQSTEPLIIYKKEDGTLNTVGLNDRKKLIDLNAPNYLRNKDKITPTVATTNTADATVVDTFKVTKNVEVVTRVNVGDKDSNMTPKNEGITVRKYKNAKESLLKRVNKDVEQSVEVNSIVTSKQESDINIKIEDSEVNIDKTESKNNNDTKSQNLVVLENKLLSKGQPTNVKKDATGPSHFITCYKNFVHSFKARQLYIPSNRIDDHEPSTSKIPNSKSILKPNIISSRKPKKPPLATLKRKSTAPILDIQPKITVLSVKSILPEKKPKMDIQIQTVKIIKMEPDDNNET